MKNKTRQDFVKPMRMISLVSLLILVASVMIAFLSGDLVNIGYFSVLIGLAAYICLHILHYRLMRKCRCRKCGHVEVFEMRKMVVVGVLRRCPKCNSKLKANEIVD